MQLLNDTPWLAFMIAALAVWRITLLLNAEDGPFDLFFHLRRILGKSLVGRLVDCFYCLSIWIAAPAGWLLGRNWPERILIWLALSALSIFIEIIHRKLAVNYSEGPVEQEGGDHELLR